MTDERTPEETPDAEVQRLLTEIFEDLAAHRRGKINKALSAIASARIQIQNIHDEKHQTAVGAAGQFLSVADSILREFRDTEIRV